MRSGDVERKLEEALKTLMEWLEKNPTDGPMRYGLAALLAVMGRFPEAEAELERAECLGVDGSVLRRWIAGKKGSPQATDETT
jgi:protein involved in temperature-dependent protein secretion